MAKNRSLNQLIREASQGIKSAGSSHEAREATAALYSLVAIRALVQELGIEQASNGLETEGIKIQNASEETTNYTSSLTLRHSPARKQVYSVHCTVEESGDVEIERVFLVQYGPHYLLHCYGVVVEGEINTSDMRFLPAFTFNPLLGTLSPKEMQELEEGQPSRLVRRERLRRILSQKGEAPWVNSPSRLPTHEKQ